MTDASSDRLVLRHWPTLLTFAGIALLCFAGLVPMTRRAATMRADGQPEKLVLVWLLCLLLLVLGVSAIAKLRERLVFDDHGVTMVKAVGRHTIPWSEVTGWEVESGPRRWLIRAWCDERPIVVFRLLLPSGFGHSTVLDETYPEPPLAAPGSVHRTFDELVVHWQAARDADG